MISQQRPDSSRLSNLDHKNESLGQRDELSPKPAIPRKFDEGNHIFGSLVVLNTDNAQCARALGCQANPRVRDALLKDDEDIRSLLHAVVASEKDSATVLALLGSAAEKFLTLAYTVSLEITISSSS